MNAKQIKENLKNRCTSLTNATVNVMAVSMDSDEYRERLDLYDQTKDELFKMIDELELKEEEPQ